MASLRKFPRSPYWYACYLGAHGRYVQQSTKETDSRIAQKIADKFEHVARQARAGGLIERQARKVIAEIYELTNREELRTDSLREFLLRWLERVKVESSYKTHQRYEGIVTRFLSFLGLKADLSVAHLASADIVRFRDHLAARKHSSATVNVNLATIQAALSRAFSDGLVDVNEASRVPRLREDSRKQQRRAFTEEELRAILEHATASGAGWCSARPTRE